MGNRLIPKRIKDRIRHLIRVMPISASSKDVIQRLQKETGFRVSINTVQRVKHGSTTAMVAAREARLEHADNESVKSRFAARPPGYDLFCECKSKINDRAAKRVRLQHQWVLWNTQSSREKAVWARKTELRDSLRRQAMKQLRLRTSYEALSVSDKIRVSRMVNPQLNMEDLFERLRRCQTMVKAAKSNISNSGDQTHTDVTDADGEDDETESNWEKEIQDGDLTDEEEDSVSQRSEATPKKMSMLKGTGARGVGRPRNPSATPETRQRQKASDKPPTIDCIIDHDIVDGHYQFQVTWVGKPESQTTWVSTVELHNSIITLKDYLERKKLNNKVRLEFEDGHLVLQDKDSSGKIVVTGTNSGARKRPREHEEEELNQESSGTEEQPSSAHWKTNRMTRSNMPVTGGFATPAARVGYTLIPTATSGKSKSSARYAGKLKAAPASTTPTVASKRRKLSQVEISNSQYSSPEPEIIFPTLSAFKSPASTYDPKIVPRDGSGRYLQQKRPDRRTLLMVTDAGIKAQSLRESSKPEDAVPKAQYVQPEPSTGNKTVKNASENVAEVQKTVGGVSMSVADHAVTVTEDFVFEDPALLGRKTGFQLGWTPDRIVAVVPNSYPKRYVVKWEGSRVVEQVEKAVLMEHVPRMLINFLESHV